MNENKSKKVVVAMSGGVDSSVAAALLKEQGYDVVGVFMKNWSQEIEGILHCPWAEDQKDMRRVCQKLDIPYYTFDFEKEYEHRIVEYFFREYGAGRTPNPDVFCNKEIKFDLFLKKAKQLGAEMIATGHYARAKKDECGKAHLLKGRDTNKDQSYFLCMLGQNELKDTLFPVGELVKSQVRQKAKELGLPTAEKKDSQGICFLGNVKVREFLKTRLKVKKGSAIDKTGKVIGEHEGVWFYTIGQRAGLSSVKWEGDAPTLFVIEKDLKNNILVIGPEAELYSRGLICDNVNWVVESAKLPLKVCAAIRYRQKPAEAEISEIDGKLKVMFKEVQRAITPGQSVVFYVGEELIGGAIIEKNI